MPLLDHFNPPLSRTHPWRSFFGAWAAAAASLLNAGVLPPGYYALPFVDRIPSENELRDAPSWAPGAPLLSVAIEWPALDNVRVEVFADEGDPRLAAAIELVSPRNKDRPRAREAFVAKVVDHLERGCGVVVVDVVTTRRADLHAELLAALGSNAASPAPGLSAVAYRSVGGADDGRLLIWPAALEIGQALPTLPLWLAGADIAVPLDLDASHTAACADLRIRQAG